VEGAAACSIATKTLILQYINCREADRLDTAPGEPLFFASIVQDLCLPVVGHPIDLHGETCRRTVEIENIRTNRMLAPETQSVQGPAAQRAPEYPFR
jgi:hypothetical protein